MLVNVKDLEDLEKKIVFFNFDCGYVLTSCLLLYPQSFNIQLLIFRKLFIFPFFHKPGAVRVHCTFPPKKRIFGPQVQCLTLQLKQKKSGGKEDVGSAVSKH